MKSGIYLSGGWGYGNKGDNAIFEGMLQTFREKASGETLCVTSYCQDETKLHHGLPSIPSVHRLLAIRKPGSWPRWLAVLVWRMTGHKVMLSAALREHIEKMSAAKAVVFGGGGYFNDDWPDMLRAKYVEIEMANSVGTPVVIYGQTVGPFSDETINASLATALKGVSRVAYRDVQSAKVLDKAGVEAAKRCLTADEANLLSKRTWVRPGALQGVQLLVGVMIQKLRPHLGAHGPSPKGRITDTAQYIDTVVAGLERVASSTPGIGFVFIPSTTWDEPICAKIYEKLMQKGVKSATFLRDPLAADFIAACQDVDVMVSTNMHPVILAATAGKPSVAISYHYKLDDYMKSIGLDDAILKIDDFDSATLCAQTLKAIENRGAISASLIKRHEKVRDGAKLNFATLSQVFS